jgi:putative acetyltransferase
LDCTKSRREALDVLQLGPVRACLTDYRSATSGPYVVRLVERLDVDDRARCWLATVLLGEPLAPFGDGVGFCFGFQHVANRLRMGCLVDVHLGNEDAIGHPTRLSDGPHRLTKAAFSGLRGHTRRVRVTTAAQRPDSPIARELIDELDAIFAPNYPPESRHGYSAEKLLREDVAFFVVSVDDEPAGCGGVQALAEGYAELKRMYVRPAFRGRGLGTHLVDYLSGYAADRGITAIRLRTGLLQVEAIGLYTSMGFRRIPPFGPYHEDAVSLCLERQLTPPGRVLDR